MSTVSETVLAYLPAKRKSTQNGWLSFNAPCCTHNGHSADTRGRGGLISNPDGGVSYHCFNCGFKTSWQPGRNLSYKMRRLLQWMNAPDSVINKLALDVMRENEGIEAVNNLRGTVSLPKFNTVPLPEDAVRIRDIPDYNEHCKGFNSFLQVVEYIVQRQLNLDDTDYYWSPSLAYRDRLIVPFYYEGRVVGWTARTVATDKNPRYLMESQPGFVYGLDEQTPNKIFCIVVEGPIDAVHVEGCAMCGSDINDQQALLLDRLGKQIIIVPDRDRNGQNLAEQAIERGWSVSMPDWPEDCKDVSDIVNRYGRLYALHSIVAAAEESPLKIKLRMKRWFT